MFLYDQAEVSFITLSQSIVEWHCETFPQCTQDSQIKKFCEEYLEFLEKHEIKELVDMYIVSVVLAGRYMRPNFISVVGEEFAKTNLTREDLKDLIIDKMNINKKRKWEYTNGVYHHKEEK